MDTTSTSRRIRWAKFVAAGAIAGTLAAAGSGCMISRSKTDFSGTFVAADTVRQIEPGESQASVLDLLGPPSAKFQIDENAERWTWRWSKTRRSTDRVLLLSSSRQEVHQTGAAWVEFEGGRVTSAWRQ